MPSFVVTDVLTIRLLGGFRVTIGGQELPESTWRRKQAATLMQLLALAPGHRLHREQIAEALWPEAEAEAASGSLRVLLHRARSLLEDAGAAPGTLLTRAGESVILGSPETVQTDVAAFETAVVAAWRGEDPVAAEAALALYRGDLLPEEPYSDWVEGRRAALRASFLSVLARLAAIYERGEDPGRAIATLERLVAAEPTREEAHAELMRLLALTGQRGRALAQFERLAEILARDVGAAPEPATHQLAAAIRLGDFPAQVVSLVAPSPSDAGVRQLVPLPAPHMRQAAAAVPAPPDALVGREQEVAELRQLLSGSRLITLTGPGGVGKTRLALAVVHERGGEFADGAAFIDLSPVRDAGLVVSSIAHALGVREEVGQPILASLTGYLAPRRSLLVLDNLEQVLAAAPEVAALLAACPTLKILATSRARLRVRGEREYPVGPLPLGESSGSASSPMDTEGVASPAATLFVERARASKSSFTLTAENARDVQAICARLDGLPLAIELAAAWVRLLSLPALLKRLEERRLALAGGARDLPDRQQTIRATITWSHDLLGPAEQVLFRRLSVFVGGWTLAAAQAVTDPEAALGRAVVEGLAALVEHSLVTEREQPDGEPRFGMLETIREFAYEHLVTSGEVDTVEQAHAEYHLRLAENADWDDFAAQVDLLDQLDADQANFRRALNRFARCDLTNREEYGRLAAALAYFWWIRGHFSEGLRTLEEAIAAADGIALTIRAKMLSGAALLAEGHSNLEQAQHYYEEALELYGEIDDPYGRAVSLTGLGGIARDLGDLSRARLYHQDALTQWSEIGDEAGMAGALLDLTSDRLIVGDYAESEAAATEAYQRFHRLHDVGGAAAALQTLGFAAVATGRLSVALERFGESLERWRTISHRQMHATDLCNLGEVYRLIGNLDEAERHLHDALELFEILDNQAGRGQVLNQLGFLALDRGDEAQARSLLRESLRFRWHIGERGSAAETLEGLAEVNLRTGDMPAAVEMLRAANFLRQETGHIRLPVYEDRFRTAFAAIDDRERSTTPIAIEKLIETEVGP